MMSKKTSDFIKQHNKEKWDLIKIIEDKNDEWIKEYIDDLKKTNYDFLKKRFGCQSFRDFIEVRSRQQNELQDKFYNILFMLPKNKSTYNVSSRKLEEDDITTARHWNHLFNRIVNHSENPDNVHYALMVAREKNINFSSMLIKRLIQSKILDVDEVNDVYTTFTKDRVVTVTTFRSFYECIEPSFLTKEDIAIQKIMNELVPKSDITELNATVIDHLKNVTSNNISYKIDVSDNNSDSNSDDNITRRRKKDNVSNDLDNENMFIDSDFSDLDFSCSEDERVLLTPKQILTDKIEIQDDFLEEKQLQIDTPDTPDTLDKQLKEKEIELQQRELHLKSLEIALNKREAELNKKIENDEYNKRVYQAQKKSIKRVIEYLSNLLEERQEGELIYLGDMSMFLAEVGNDCEVTL